MHWVSLPAGSFGASASVPGIDANFVWADGTAFRDFARSDGAGNREVPDELPFIVQLNDGDSAMNVLAATKGCRVPPVYARSASSLKTRYFTAHLSAEFLREELGKEVRHRAFKRFELQMPVIPQHPRPRSDIALPAEGKSQRSVAGNVVIGVIDSGCAFANRRLMKTDGKHTRLLSIWDQDDRPAFTRSGYEGKVPASLGYGREATRGLLNRLIRDSSMGGIVNEDACYELANVGLRRRFSHGTAVTDLAAGNMALGSRLGLEPDQGPTLKTATDAASKADIVFVQLPRDVVQDSSSASLSRYLLDGMRYILSCASDKTKHVVVNVSDGSSRGSHDGESIIEKAMLDLIAKNTKPFTIEIVVAAGNSRDEERHAQWDQLHRGKSELVRLRLPPDSYAPSYVSVVLPPSATDVEVRLIPPGETPESTKGVRPGDAFVWPSTSGSQCGVVYPAIGAERSSSRTCVLLALAPTASFDGSACVAPSGDWSIELTSEHGCSEAIHLYISRNQTNAGALRRGLQARFIDTTELYDPDRCMREAEDDPTEEAKSPIRRNGTLSSLATLPSGQGVFVAAGYLWREGTLSLYASAGPAEGVPQSKSAPRQGPDYGLVTDISRAEPGISVAGARSGDVVRVKGTSFAVPQLVRHLIQQKAAPNPIPVRKPGPANSPAPAKLKAERSHQLLRPASGSP